MNIVIDSNIVAATQLALPYSQEADSYLEQWSNANARLLAPTLFEYEIASILRRFEAAKIIQPDESQAMVTQILALEIEIIPPSIHLHQQSLHWAKRLGQSKAYDAQYLALAEQEDAQFWSGDKRLVNGAKQLGVDWVHGIGEPPPAENSSSSDSST